MKKNIDIRIIVDSREKDLTFLYDFDFDEKYSKDKIRIKDWIKEYPFKCLDKNGKEISISTGDVGIEYSVNGGRSWIKTHLCIELKKENDFSSTLFSDWKRFKKEIQRAKENSVDFYIIYNQTFAKMKKTFEELKLSGKINKNIIPEKVIMQRVIELNNIGIKLIFSDDLPRMIKTIIQEYVKNNIRIGDER